MKILGKVLILLTGIALVLIPVIGCGCGSESAYLLEQAIDGTLYTVIDSSGTTYVLSKSTTGGVSWSATNAPTGDYIVAIACSPVYANVVYFATETAVYKSNDAGDTFITLATTPLEAITALDVAYYGGRCFVMVGAGGGGAANNAEVYTLDESGTFPPIWNNMLFNPQMVAAYALATGLDLIPAVAFTPDVTATLAMVAIGNEAGAGATCISMKVGSAFWGGTIGNPISTLAATCNSAAIAFPDDFSLSASPFFYFGISDTAGANEGVYSFWGQPWLVASFITANNVAAGNDVVSLDTGGEFGVGAVLAGLQNGTVARSPDGGSGWFTDDVTGSDYTYVVLDCLTSNQAWAMVHGTGGGLSFTTTSGDIWYLIWP